MAALLYSLTLSRHHTADSLIYALAIERDDFRALIDPTHLLIHPTALIWYRAWQAAGWTGRSLLPLQMLNALAGAICVGLMWSLARSLSHSSRTAAVIALGFAVSGGLWLLSVEAEFVTFPLAMQLLVLWWLLGAPSEHIGRSWYALLLGLLVAIAILTYLTSALLILVAIVGYLAADLKLAAKSRQIALFFATLLLVITPVLLVSLTIWSEGHFDQLRYLGGQGVYGQLKWLNIPHGIYAFLRSIGLFPGLVMNDSTKDLLSAAGNQTRLIFVTYYSLIAFLGLLPAIGLIRHSRTLWTNARRTLLVLLTWVITFAAFAFYWVPGDITFWLPLLAAWWLITAICWPLLNTPRLLSGTLLVVLLLGIVNASLVILPRTVLENNRPHRLAEFISQETEIQDTILIASNNITILTIIYFSNRHVLSIESPVRNKIEVPPSIINDFEKRADDTGRLLILQANGTLRELR